jgi:hypothetical protein
VLLLLFGLIGLTGRKRIVASNSECLRPGGQDKGSGQMGVLLLENALDLLK